MLVNFTETVLRDANQSLIATRLPLNKFESILNEMDTAGYYSVECWGGATFDSCIRYLGEDPWERLKIIKSHMPHTKLQMLLRGQSLLGYKHYPDDVVRKFIYNSVEKGIDIIRIFDALNDLKNLEVAVDETLKCGAHPSCAISYTVSPVHSVEKYVKLAKNMESMGAKSICIKDMSGILSPTVAFELIGQLKANLTVPIVLHSHCSTGFAYMTYLKAIEAGIDVLDTAVSSFSGGTSQPATDVISRVAVASGHAVTLNMDSVNKINDYFSEVMNEYMKSGGLEPRVLLTEPKTIENQIPGGMYSNLLSQLKALKLDDRLNEVLMEVINVRKDLGYPPLVTPISQMVGTQATMNVISGKRYQTPIEEIKAYFRGEYGVPPGDVDLELMNSLVGKNEFPKERYSKSIPPLYEEVKKGYEDKRYGRSDILTAILFPNIGEKFIEQRNSEKSKMFIYDILECTDDIVKSSWVNVTNAVSDVVEAVLIAVVSHKLGLHADNICLNTIYEMEG